MDKNLKIEETIDAKNERIVQLEKDLQRRNEEVELRKEIIESMSASLMRHEKESAELANKLVLMKNQILEFNVGNQIQRKYAGVKIGGKQMVPVYVNFTSVNTYSLNSQRKKEKSITWLQTANHLKFQLAQKILT